MDKKSKSMRFFHVCAVSAYFFSLPSATADLNSWFNTEKKNKVTIDGEVCVYIRNKITPQGKRVYGECEPKELPLEKSKDIDLYLQVNIAIEKKGHPASNKNKINLLTPRLAYFYNDVLENDSSIEAEIEISSERYVFQGGELLNNYSTFKKKIRNNLNDIPKSFIAYEMGHYAWDRIENNCNGLNDHSEVKCLINPDIKELFKKSLNESHEYFVDIARYYQQVINNLKSEGNTDLCSNQLNDFVRLLKKHNDEKILVLSSKTTREDFITLIDNTLHSAIELQLNSYKPGQMISSVLADLYVAEELMSNADKLSKLFNRASDTFSDKPDLSITFSEKNYNLLRDSNRSNFKDGEREASTLVAIKKVVDKKKERVESKGFQEDIIVNSEIDNLINDLFRDAENAHKILKDVEQLKGENKKRADRVFEEKKIPLDSIRRQIFNSWYTVLYRTLSKKHNPQEIAEVLVDMHSSEPKKRYFERFVQTLCGKSSPLLSADARHLKRFFDVNGLTVQNGMVQCDIEMTARKQPEESRKPEEADVENHGNWSQPDML